MLLIKSIYKKTPQSRFRVRYKFFNKYINSIEVKTKYKPVNCKLITGRWGVKHKKFYKKIELKPLINFKKLYTLHYIVNISNYRTKMKEVVEISNVYGCKSLLASIKIYYPGFKLYPKVFLETKPTIKKFIGQHIPLIWIPINMLISHVYNLLNYKSTYIKSSGSYGVRKKLNKHSKLINILLPSGKVKIFPIFVIAIFSATSNLYTNKIVEGGWGFFPKNKKNIAVRGVAKNPVDHPNGGRTKAKQPELSPWGWVAKLRK